MAEARTGHGVSGNILHVLNRHGHVLEAACSNIDTRAMRTS